MKYAIFLAALVNVTGCAGLITDATPNNASMPVKAAAVAADTAILWRAWELLGYVK